MNDRFEPRQLGAGGAGFGRAGSDDDPLLELARIVSGRPTQPETRRRSPFPTTDSSSESDLVRDLEAELLSDLQASFARQRSAPAATAAPDPEIPAAVQPESDAGAGRTFGFLSLRRGAAYEPHTTPQPVAAVAVAPVEPPAADPFDALRFDYPEAVSGTGADAEPAPETAGPGHPDDDFNQPLWTSESGFAPAGYEATEDQLQSLEPPPARGGWRSRRGLTLVAGAFAVVLLGGVAMIALRGDDATAGAPAIITADRSPIRLAAVDPAPNPADANTLIFDRVGASGGEIETVLAPAEDPVPDVAGLGPGENGISRVILRGAPGDDAIGGILAAEPAAVPPADIGETVAPTAGPRRVRTVTVRPDGTIVENGAAPAGETPVAAVVAAPDALALGAVPAPPPAVEAAAEVAATPPARELPTVVAALPPPAEPVATAVLRPTVVPPTPAPDTTAATRPAPARTPAATRAPISLMPDVAGQAPPAAVPPVRTAAVAPAQTPAAAAPAPAPVVGGGGFVVQVSSQRTEEAALSAFRALQARLPSLLGGREANIQRANLGDRGTFYRARVAPATGRDDAIRLCQSLKAAGVDCIVAQN